MVRLTRAEQVEKNREAVLDAAYRVFVDRGYAGAGIEAIAEAAGFSRGVVYSQFGSKADLFLALLDRRIEARAAQNRRAADGRWGADALSSLLEATHRDAVENRGWAEVLVEFRVVAGREPDLARRYRAAHTRTIEHLAAVLRTAHGEAAPGPGVLRRQAEFVLAFGAGFTLERMNDEDALPFEQASTMLARALGLDRGGTT